MIGEWEAPEERIEHAPRPRRRDHSADPKPRRSREREKLPTDETTRRREPGRGGRAGKAVPEAAGNGHVKLFVNRGTRSGIGEDELRWALTEGAVIPEDSIGEIRVLERFSFVELSDEHAKLALERLDGTKLEGKQIRVEYANE